MAYHCFGEVSIHVLDKLKEACDLEVGRREVGYRVTIHMNDHLSNCWITDTQIAGLES